LAVLLKLALRSNSGKSVLFATARKSPCDRRVRINAWGHAEATKWPRTRHEIPGLFLARRADQLVGPFAFGSPFSSRQPFQKSFRRCSVAGLQWHWEVIKRKPSGEVIRDCLGGELTQIKCYRKREVDEGSADTLTHIRGYRSPGNEFISQTRSPFIPITAGSSSTGHCTGI